MFWKKESQSPVGLIAGRGQLPLVFAKAARCSGRRIVAFGLKGQTDAHLKGLVEKFFEIELGQVGKLISLLKENKLKGVVLAGGIPKKEMYNPALDLDTHAQYLMNGAKNRGDDHLLRAFGIFLKTKAGVDVLDLRMLLKDTLAHTGVMTRTAPDTEEWEDLKFGHEAAKMVGRLDIGQTVVVKRGVVLAVEALEGTDEAIRRGAELGNGRVVVVKTSKPKQDLRFDLPCVGLDTLDGLKAQNSKVLGVEAGKTIMLEKQKMIEFADRQGLVIVGL